MGAARPNRDPETPGRATPVEIFFDVVFVLTVTQLVRLLDEELDGTNVGHTVLIFGLLWYLYTGYVWLTNHVPPHGPARKLLLFGGMAGYLLTATAIPDALDGTGLLFGLGYLLVVAVHLTLFHRSSARAGVRRLAPYNLGAAVLILTAGLLDGPAVPALWGAAVFTQTVLPYLLPGHSWLGAAASFHITPAHFVERHGLLVIIALGEVVVTIGMGTPLTQLGPGTAAALVMALALPAALWWTYFTDAPAAETSLDHAVPATRSRYASRVYILDHFLLLLGVIATATGMHAVVAHPTEPTGWPKAFALCGGVALFLLAVADARRVLRTGPVRGRLVTAALVLASAPLGALLDAALLLAALIAILTGMRIRDAGLTRRALRLVAGRTG
ncbi:low temperature requirement protein A [Micromonospora krabiensis]|uniref:Low temperature requirement protein LtrA n=1 Tax=Micromonospora krabiensis TaxID=307121 RepID=A0A1C3MZ97_9ACTN|nr:low temperature requirement protein A [Micromonospora krabiensis]SBV25667.1 Low temperature requirement protein LtrA [Micromonospora krabiensis]